MPRPRGAARFRRAAIATPHHLASIAGLTVLHDGGNAVDAVLAANLTLAVVAPYYCGFGGDLFALVWDGRLHGLAAAGRAAAAATPDAVRERAGAPAMPVLGGLAVTVPQAVEGWFALLERWGTRSFGSLASSARRHAAEGVALTPYAVELLDGCRAIYAEAPSWTAAYGDAAARRALHQPAMVRLLDLLAERGPDAYYRGEVAAAIARADREAGGLLDESDLAAHAASWVEPLRACYRDVEVAGMPPPSQGVALLEALRIVDGFDLETLEDADREHLLVEACRLALADRDRWVSDPDAMARPAGALLVPDHVAERGARLDPHGAARPRALAAQQGGTAYLAAADADGLLVSLIQSNFLAFGSGVHVPEWGINLQNRGASFSLDPASVNVVAPRKQPLHTLMPGVALRGGEPWLVFGSMGGDAQPAINLQLLHHLVDGAADPQVAVAAPRWRIDPPDGELVMESRFAPRLREALAARGHPVRVSGAFDSGMGHAHVIGRAEGGYAAATDPRAEGAALGL